MFIELESAAVFLFVFAVVFGTLSVASLFDRRVNSLIALAIAFFTLTNGTAALFIWNLMPFATILFFVLFFIALVRKFMIGKREEATPLIVALGLLLLSLSTLTQNLGYWFGIPAGDFGLAAGVIIVALMFYLAWSLNPSS